MNSNITILAAALLLLPCSANAGYVGVGDKAPAFQAVTIDGQNISIDNPTNAKPVLLVFWATWCPYCEAAVPKLKKIYSAYSPKDLTFVSINPGVNDSLRKVRLFVEKYNLPYPVIYDKGGAISKTFGVNGVPTVIIVGRNDIVRYRGGIPSDIDKLIKPPSPAPEIRSAALTRKIIPGAGRDSQEQ